MADVFVSTLGRNAPARNPLPWSSLLPAAPGRAAAWSVPEAFLAVLISAVTCDGEVAEVENEELTALAHRSRALRSLSPVHALDLVLADGELTIDEADFLNALILHLKLDRYGVAKVSDVIVLKAQV